MAKKICKKCKAKCCTCEGCDPSKFVDGICPSCIKKERNAISSDKELQELRYLNGYAGINRLQPEESTS